MHFTAMPQINRMAAPADNEAAKTELSVPGWGGGEVGEKGALRAAKSCWVLLTAASEGRGSC